MFAIRLRHFLVGPGFRSATRSSASTSRIFGGESCFTWKSAAHHSTIGQSRTVSPGPRVKWQEAWSRAQQKRGYRRQAFNYQRFQTTQGVLGRWAARPTFIYEVAGLGAVVGGVYVYNLEPVPVSGRRRFNVVSSEREAAQGEMMYQQVLQEFGKRIMPPQSREHRMVQKVLRRLIPHSGLEGNKWETFVIDDDMKNAFVIPGGKVFVFRGILDVCEGEDGLAAVLGHEIAHNVAHHAAERMSQSWILLAAASVGQFFLGLDMGLSNLVLNLTFSLPGSRSQEQEADFIGLMMMAESCYDPSAAIGLWSRMEKEEKGTPPQFLSTHPSSHNRLEKIRGWLTQAETKREESGCGTAAVYADDFKRFAGVSRW